LDLRRTAHAQFRSAVLRYADIAGSDALPAKFREVPPVPRHTDKEQREIHNVTSQLLGFKLCTDIIGNAVQDVCDTLGIAVPTKRRKHAAKVALMARLDDTSDGDNKLEEQGSAMKDSSEDEADVEDALAKHDVVLGNPLDDENPDDGDEGKTIIDLRDDMSVSDTPSPTPSDQVAAEQPPKRKPKIAKPERAGVSDFLPTLMGGYISGSESASDVDVAPAKKRLGQRQRRAKAERKEAAKAKKLLRKQKRGKDDGRDHNREAVANFGGNGVKEGLKKHKGVPDNVWSSGQPVTEDDASQQRKGSQDSRWHSRQAEHIFDEKAGVREDVVSGSQNKGGAPDKQKHRGERKPVAPLHPSWEAAKKRAAKLAQPIKIQGTKIVFE
jgi:BUD22